MYWGTCGVLELWQQEHEGTLKAESQWDCITQLPEVAPALSPAFWGLHLMEEAGGFLLPGTMSKHALVWRLRAPTLRWRTWSL